RYLTFGLANSDSISDSGATADRRTTTCRKATPKRSSAVASVPNSTSLNELSTARMGTPLRSSQLVVRHGRLGSSQRRPERPRLWHKHAEDCDGDRDRTAWLGMSDSNLDLQQMERLRIL